MQKTILCEAGQEQILVRNIAARGLVRTFTLDTSKNNGTITVLSSIFPFFILKSEKTLPLVSGTKVKRGFFDASFQLSVQADEDTEVTLS